MPRVRITMEFDADMSMTQAMEYVQQIGHSVRQGYWSVAQPNINNGVMRVAAVKDITKEEPT